MIRYDRHMAITVSQLLHYGGFGIRSYKKLRSEVSYPMSYPDYLLLKHNSFFVRLITCPLCSSVWVSVMISSSVGWQYLPFLIVVPLMLYNHLEAKF